jgi:hypothetical protein
VADSKRFYVVKTETEGMAGFRQSHAVVGEEPGADPKLSVRLIAPSTALSEWAPKAPNDPEPPIYTPREP